MEHIGTLVEDDVLDQSPLDGGGERGSADDANDGPPPPNRSRTQSSGSAGSSGSAATGASSRHRGSALSVSSQDVPSFRFGKSSKRDSFSRDPSAADVALYKDGIKKQDEGHADAGRLVIAEPSRDEVVEEYEVARRERSRPGGALALLPELSPIGERVGGTTPGSTTPRRTPVRVVDAEYLAAEGLPSPPLFQHVDEEGGNGGKSSGGSSSQPSSRLGPLNDSDESPDSILPEVNPRRKSEEGRAPSRRRRRRVYAGSLLALVLLVAAAAAVAAVLATRDGGATAQSAVARDEPPAVAVPPSAGSRVPTGAPAWAPGGGIFDDAAAPPGGIFDAGPVR